MIGGKEREREREGGEFLKMRSSFFFLLLRARRSCSSLSLSFSLSKNPEHKTHDSGGLGGVLRQLERDLDVGLRAQVVDLVGLGGAVFF